MEKQPVRVTIYHQSFSLLAQGDPAALERAAQTVDTLIHNLAQQIPTADPTKLAILACLHLADKLQSLEAMSALLDDILVPPYRQD